MGSTTNFREWLEQFCDGLQTDERADLARAVSGGDTYGVFSSKPTPNGKGVVIYSDLYSVDDNLVLPTEKSKQAFLSAVNSGSDFGDAELDEMFWEAMAKDD